VGVWSAIRKLFFRLPVLKLALRGIQELKGGGHVAVRTGSLVATTRKFYPTVEADSPLERLARSQLVVHNGQSVRLTGFMDRQRERAAVGGYFVSGMSPHLALDLMGDFQRVRVQALT
jgi:hypothetical protein